jgi:hypothetical protein
MSVAIARPTELGFLWLLLQLSEEAQEALWNRLGRLVFPQLAERTTHPIDGGFTSRTLFQCRRSLEGRFHGGLLRTPPSIQKVTSGTGRRSH